MTITQPIKLPFIAAVDYLKSKYKLNTDEFCDNLAHSLNRYFTTVIQDISFKQLFLNNKSAVVDSKVSFHDVTDHRVFHFDIEMKVTDISYIRVNLEYLLSDDKVLEKMTWIAISICTSYGIPVLLAQYKQESGAKIEELNSDSPALNELLIIKRFAKEWGKLASQPDCKYAKNEEKPKDTCTEIPVKDKLTTNSELPQAPHEKGFKLYENVILSRINQIIRNQSIDQSQVDIFNTKLDEYVKSIAARYESLISAKDIENYFNSSTSVTTETPTRTRDSRQPEVYDWAAIKEACKHMSLDHILAEMPKEQPPKPLADPVSDSIHPIRVRDYISMIPTIKLKAPDPEIIKQMKELAKQYQCKFITPKALVSKPTDIDSWIWDISYLKATRDTLRQLEPRALSQLSVSTDGQYQVIPTDKAVWPQVEVKGIHLKQSKPLAKIKEPIPEILTRLYQRSVTDPKESDVMQNNQNTVKEFLKQEFAQGQLQSTDFKRSVYSALCGWYKHYGTLSTALVDNILVNNWTFENMTFAKTLAKSGDRENKPTNYFFSFTNSNDARFSIKVTRSSEDFTIDQIVIEIVLPSGRPLNTYIWDASIVGVAGSVADFPAIPPFPAAEGFLETIAEIELGAPEPLKEPVNVKPSAQPAMDGSRVIGKQMTATELLKLLETVTQFVYAYPVCAATVQTKETKLDLKDTCLKIAASLAAWDINASVYLRQVADVFFVNHNAFENMTAFITGINENSLSATFNYCLRGDVYLNINCKFAIGKTHHQVTNVEVFISKGGKKIEEVNYVKLVTACQVITAYQNYFYKLAGSVTPEQVQRILDSESHSKLLAETKKRVEKQATEQLTQIQSTLLGVLLDNGFDYPKGLVDVIKQVVLDQSKMKVFATPGTFQSHDKPTAPAVEMCVVIPSSFDKETVAIVEEEIIEVMKRLDRRGVKHAVSVVGHLYDRRDPNAAQS